MTGWIEVSVASLVFLGSHAVAVRPFVKRPLVARLGRRGFALLYSALSLALLVWVLAAAGRAPPVPLWPLGEGVRLIALTLMLAASVLAAQALMGTNPLSFGSRPAPFDPDRPGIAGLSRHPLLLALALWALAHGLANGDLAHLLVFGAMGGFALAGMPMIDARKRRELPDWPKLAKNAPLLGWPVHGPPLLPGVIGIALWAVLWWLHPLVIGVAPL